LEGFGLSQSFQQFLAILSLLLHFPSHLVKGLLQLQRIPQWKRKSAENTGYAIQDIETGGAWRGRGGKGLSCYSERKYDIL
jgi:hypothetical protein